MFTKPQNIYFDQASTSTKTSEFIKEYSKLLSTFTLPSHNLISEISLKIASYLSVHSALISFAPNATSAINEIAKEISDSSTTIKTIYLSKSEHLANVLPWLKIHKEKKWPIVFFDLLAFKNLKIKKNSIVSLSSLTNLDGYSLSIEEINSVIDCSNKPLLIVDATQSIQHKIANLSKSKIDYLFFSAHKFFGPNGIGVIYSKLPSKNIGINQDNQLIKNSYQLDWKGLSAWNETFETISSYFLKNKQEKQELELLLFFKEYFPKDNKYIKWINPESNTLIFLLRTYKITAHDLAFFLEKNNVVVRTGLSCSLNEKYKKIAGSLVRVSLNCSNQVSELKIFFKLIKNLKIGDCF